jgi:hypothetical protein
LKFRKKIHFWLTFVKVQDPWHLQWKWRFNVQKAQNAAFFSYILTWISAWRHSRGHFFNSSTPESVPGLRCF